GIAGKRLANNPMGNCGNSTRSERGGLGGGHVLVEVATVFGGLHVSSADSEVAKALTGQAVAGVIQNDGTQQGRDLLGLHRSPVELVQAIPGKASPEVEVVNAGAFSDEGDLGNVGPRTAVGAAGHANGDGVLTQSGLLEDLLQFSDELGQVALGFGESQAAGRQGDAAHRVEPQGTAVDGVENAVLGEQLFDARLLLRRDL